MKDTFNLFLQVTITLLQFYVGLVLLLTPEKAHIGHYMIVLFISVPVLVGYYKRRHE